MAFDAFVILFTYGAGKQNKKYDSMMAKKEMTFTESLSELNEIAKENDININDSKVLIMYIKRHYEKNN